MAMPPDRSTIDVHLPDGARLAVVYTGDESEREAVQDAVIETVLAADGDVEELCALLDERVVALGRTASRATERDAEILTID